MTTAISESAHPSRLTGADELVLDFERSWWRATDDKDSAIRACFGTTAPVYYRRLARLIEHPAALAHDPLLVRRLRRLVARGVAAERAAQAERRARSAVRS